jgi:hypothetical protein
MNQSPLCLCVEIFSPQSPGLRFGALRLSRIIKKVMIEVSLAICSPEGRQTGASLIGDCLRIGLNDEASIAILDDGGFPGPHAQVCREGGETWIVDEAGISRVNGETVQPENKVLLSDGDVILIGDHSINVHIKSRTRAALSERETPEKAQQGWKFTASPRHIRLIGAAALLLLLAVAGLIGLYFWKHKRTPSFFYNPLRAISPAVNTYKQAIEKVEQDRGEPVGRNAKIDIPAELKHYKDRRRFLAIQVAEWRKQKYEIPHDFSELAEMIQRGEFTRLPPLGESYLLYGVGIKANDELTHYDEETGESVPLFSSEAELENELGHLAESLKELETKTRDLKKELDQTKKGDRQARADLQAQIVAARKSIPEIKKKKELIDSFYKSEEHRKLMVREYETLATLARDFDGKSFDLGNPDSRKEFKVRMLSYLRPAARARLEEIALAYQQKFDRPLPVTSLVRTQEYQRYLGETGNPNAIRIKVPPHTTGLAFDIFTHYMTGDEQNFLMEEVAKLERDGHVEALRENRDHVHVFAFADGIPPDESLIKKSLSGKVAADD